MHGERVRTNVNHTGQAKLRVNPHEKGVQVLLATGLKEVNRFCLLAGLTLFDDSYFT